MFVHGLQLERLYTFPTAQKKKGSFIELDRTHMVTVEQSDGYSLETGQPRIVGTLKQSDGYKACLETLAYCRRGLKLLTDIDERAVCQDVRHAARACNCPTWIPASILPDAYWDALELKFSRMLVEAEHAESASIKGSAAEVQGAHADLMRTARIDISAHVQRGAVTALGIAVAAVGAYYAFF